MKNKVLLLGTPILFVLLMVGLVLITTSQAAGQLDGVKVCLDPGHGGTDPGATNGALYESHINLDVSYGIKSLLEGQGAEVVLTREDDSYKTNNDRYTFCNLELATILVSVHTNSVTDPTWDGSLAYYGPKRTPELASAIHNVVYQYLQDTAPAGVELFRDFGVDRFASGVLFKSNMDSALIEPLFMSHPAEAALLATPIHTFDDNSLPTGANPDCNDCRRAQIAQAIYNGIIAYFAPDTTNQTPVATFTSACNALSCNFDAAESFDPEGGPITYAWDFGDGNTGSGAAPNNVYAEDGTYTVTLTVTDDQGATGTDSQDVTVSSSGGGIILTAMGYKDKGLQKADLYWTGATSANIDIYRDNNLLATTANDGVYTDDINLRGGGSYTYQVCEEGTTTCSGEADVNF